MSCETEDDSTLRKSKPPDPLTSPPAGDETGESRPGSQTDNVPPVTDRHEER